MINETEVKQEILSINDINFMSYVSITRNQNWNKTDNIKILMEKEKKE